MAILTSIDATLNTSFESGSNLDNDSTLTFVLHPTFSGARAAEFSFSGRDTTNGATHEGDKKTFNFTLLTNSLTKEQINGFYSIDIIINARGRDHYAGKLETIFHFDDGTFAGSPDFSFEVGTYHESNQTGQLNNIIKFL
ncbi:hypothetical protein [Mucilaginibacter sp.]|uniref:hypothetical protein n=1 Tax=Mucilaginibacter sp. TaxID=1882438 RepID=UPI0025D9FC00|nr:hypothetical protein [Mucilaginibacter sp.]